MHKALLLAVLVLFGVTTGVALLRHGYVDIFLLQLQTWAGVQVLLDLTIALALILVWIWRDCRQRSLNPVPWVLITLAIGSFGPLLYLLFRRPGEAQGPAGRRVD